LAAVPVGGDGGVRDSAAEDVAAEGVQVEDVASPVPPTPPVTETVCAQDEARARVCSSDCWCWMLPHGQGNDLHGVCRDGSGDLVAVGDVGTIVRDEGNGWRGEPSPTREDLQAVWCAGSGVAFAVGARGTVLRGSGGIWQVQASGTDRMLLGVWGSGPDDVFAVGEAGTILHFDGATWASQPSGIDGALRDVWVASLSDAWVVGEGGVLLHFDGTAWRAQASGTAENLNAVWGADALDVWVVGDRGAGLHYDGSWTTTGASSRYYDSTAGGWRTVPGLVFAGGDAEALIWLRAVRGDGSRLVVAAGDRGTAFARKSGGEWLDTRSECGCGYAARLLPDVFDLWPVGTGDQAAYDVLYVGPPPVLDDLHYLWREEADPDDPEGSPAVMHACGKDTAVAQEGDGWSDTYEQDACDRARWGEWAGWTDESDTAVLILGGEEEGDEEQIPVGRLAAYWRSDDGQVFIVGAGGLVLHHDDSGWHKEDGGTEVDLVSVSGSSAADVVAVGRGGVVIRFDGRSWRAERSGTTRDLLGVWRGGPDLALAVGPAGTLLRFDGTTWAPQQAGTEVDLFGVWGVAGDEVYEVYVVGAAGTVLHFDGSAWRPQDARTRRNLYAVWGSGLDDVWIAGERGTILRRGSH
jgi:hypothetical protein